MKQVVLIIGLCLVTTAAFAQKAAVTGAERMAKDSRANFNEARKLIGGALEHPETKDDAKTWYVAGQVEDAQYNAESTKQIIGQQPNEAVMYNALGNALPFYIKAYGLDQRPDDKGKIKPKYEKSIKGILGANHLSYSNGGVYYFEQKDYQKAFDMWEQYFEIANLPFMAGTKAAARDSNYIIIQYYSSMIATQLDNHELAIKALNRAKNTSYRQDDVFQNLIWMYQQQNDTVNIEKTLNEGYAIFPDSSYYLFNLINIYISTDRNEKALEMINAGLAKDATNSLLHYAMGSVYEAGLKDIEKAEASYKKALEYDPNTAANHSNLGRIYYNQAVNKLNDANLITDAKLYNEEKEVAKSLFDKARPYFEKAHQIEPQNMEYMIPLRTVYYNLNMNEEFSAIEEKMEFRYDDDE